MTREQPWAHSHVVMDCRRCGRHGETRGRGLCQPCRRRLQMYGGLDAYPRLDAERNTGNRPEHECPWCARRHRAKTEACTACRHLLDGLDLVPSPDDALDGGHWAVIAGVRRWIPTTRNEAA